MERQKFEDEFRDAFQDATFEPSEKVWTNIELDLERQESGKMKRRLLTFKLLAAASVIFALGAGTTTWIMLNDAGQSSAVVAGREDATPESTKDQNTVTENEVAGESNLKENDSNANAEEGNLADNNTEEVNNDQSSQAYSAGAEEQDNSVSGGSETPQPDDHAIAQQRAGREDYSVAGETAGTAIVTGTIAGTVSGADNDTESARQGDYYIRERDVPALVRRRPIEPVFPKTKPDEYDLMIARLEMEQKEDEEKSRFNNEKIWTSVGVAAGSFNSVSPGVSSPSLMTTPDALVAFNSANRSLSNETRASGMSYSVGVGVGTKISTRWVLQGGLNYLSQNSDYTSDAVVTEDFQNFSAATSAEYTKIQQSSSSARVVPTAPYEVNSNLQFLSFPVQAGYLVLNRDFSIQVNGGIATDLFLQNTITPESGDVTRVTNGRGSDSPYRPVNFSGLVGSEFSYRFADRYRLSVNPGIRYPFNSVYKGSLGLDATQVTFDVGLRFRYIFK